MKLVADCLCPVCQKFFAVTYVPEQDDAFGKHPIVCPSCGADFQSESVRQICDVYTTMARCSKVKILSVYQV